MSDPSFSDAPPIIQSVVLAYVIVVLVVHCACAWVGSVLAKGRMSPMAGAVIGFILGLIGFIIILCVPLQKPSTSRRSRGNMRPTGRTSRVTGAKVNGRGATRGIGRGSSSRVAGRTTRSMRPVGRTIGRVGR